MDDMFRNIPKDEIVPAVKSVLDSLRECARGKREFWFSLHRAGDKSLDRMGKAASRDYRTLEQEEVIKYVNGISTRTRSLRWTVLSCSRGGRACLSRDMYLPNSPKYGLCLKN